MTGIKAIVQGGRVVTETPLDLPDGTPLLVVCRDEAEDDWDRTPAGISAWIKWYNSLEPLVFTDEETAAWNAEQKSRKEWELSDSDKRAEKLLGLWE